LIKNLIKLGSYIKIHDPLSVDPRPVGMGVDERNNWRGFVMQPVELGNTDRC
jgi:hypothetical protein